MSVIGPRRLSAAPGAVEAPVPPGVFRRALADLRDARPRTEVRLREIPAPEGQAPFAVALAADVCDGPGATGGVLATGGSSSCTTRPRTPGGREASGR